MVFSAQLTRRIDVDDHASNVRQLFSDTRLHALGNIVATLNTS